MKTRLKLATIALILMACSFLNAKTIVPNPVPSSPCPSGQNLWCIGGTDGNPLICYCSAKP